MCNSVQVVSLYNVGSSILLPFEHVRVFSVSTIPRVGFMARFAMPVLKDIEVISRMAVPVVSAPVPAVVGTVETERLTKAPACSVLKGSRTCDEWS